MNSIKANASFIIPRLGLMVVLLWILWFITNVIQTTWVVLCKQVRTHQLHLQPHHQYTITGVPSGATCAAAPSTLLHVSSAAGEAKWPPSTCS
jgi:hypothetical protein